MNNPRKPRATPATVGAPAAGPVGPAAVTGGGCQSKRSLTPGCLVDCKVGPITLKLTSTNGTVVIVAADYGGTPVTTTATQINFTVTAGIKNLIVQFAVPAGDIGTLAEDCGAKTVWDNNINASIPVPYAICA